MKPEVSPTIVKGKAPARNSAQKKGVISYSRNVFLPVTNLCRNKCAYCGFRKEPENGAEVMSKEEILDLAKQGKEAGCSEALITLGEKPEVHEMMSKKLKEWGYTDTIDYLADLSREILNLGLLPHINPGILNEDELERLRKWNASMGLMLESTAELKAHEKSPGKDPKLRLKTIKKAGQLKIPFTTGILVGIGEEWEDRVKSLLEIRKIQEEYHHIQEVIIQPFVPKGGTQFESRKPPKQTEIMNIVSIARSMMPETNIQVPANLTQRPVDFVLAGANDLGGISTVTPDFINPGKPWPKISKLKSEMRRSGYKLKERLPIYPEFSGDSNFMSPEVGEVVDGLSNENGFRRK